MPFGPFALQWRAPHPNPPSGTPLPPGITRTYVFTPSGPLELLCAVPPSPVPDLPPLFFAHGGFGCADVWLEYMQFFAAKGYACYAVSYRGHGKSWYPGFLALYFTLRGSMARDLVAGVKWVEGIEGARRLGKLDWEGQGEGKERTRVVLVAHSNGGGLAQWALGRGLLKVEGFCMFAAVPGFGSFSCYRFWALTAPFNMLYRAGHPRYILANDKQVADAFFTASTPISVVQKLGRLLSPYESMLWPVQNLFAFVTGPDVMSSIVGWGSRSTPRGSVAPQRMLVLAAEHDVLCTPKLALDTAQRYRAGFRALVSQGKLDGLSADWMAPGRDLEVRGAEDGDRDGVRFRVVSGVAHHLQNHVEWEKGAEEILQWVMDL